MAKAYTTHEGPQPPVPSITLELDADETEVIYALLGRTASVGGGPLRKAVSRIYEAMSDIPTLTQRVRRNSEIILDPPRLRENV